jgi:hypothetical protein
MSDTLVLMTPPALGAVGAIGTRRVLSFSVVAFFC